MDSSSLSLWAGSVAVSRTQTPMDSNGLSWTLYSSNNFDSYELLWTPLVFSLNLDQLLFLKLRLLCTPMDSAELLQPFPASDLSLSLLILEHWLLWTPMDSSGLFFRAGSGFLKLRLLWTQMDSADVKHVQLSSWEFIGVRGWGKDLYDSGCKQIESIGVHCSHS
jgi:hypothetical protein